jgi:hypothetical protein
MIGQILDLFSLLIESLERPVEFGLFGHEPFQFGFGLPALVAREAAVFQLGPELPDLVVDCKHRVSPSV